MIFAAGGGAGLNLPLELAIGLSVGLLVLSFLFSGTETAFFSLQKLQKQRLEAAGGSGEQVIHLLDRRTALITTILIGNETVNIAFSATGAKLWENLTGIPWLDPLLPVLLVTPILVLVSEITPKVLAYRFNVQWSRAVAWPLSVFYWVVFPIRILIAGIVTLIARAFGVTPQATEEGLQEAELLNLLSQGAAAGSVDHHEREMVEAVLDFEALTVSRVMTPKPEMVALDIQAPWTDIVDACRAEGFSRVPVYDGEPDNVVGVLLLKDVLKHRLSPPAGPRQLRSLLLPPVFVPQSKPAPDMLEAFLERRYHLAFAVDEHGTLVGIVTLDDVLSELFGDFPDEDEEDEEDVAPAGQGRWHVQAAVDLDELLDATGIEIPEGDYHTLGGFVYHQLGRLPHKGDAFSWDNHRYVVKQMDGRRIVEVLITTVASPTPAELPTGEHHDG